MVIEYIDIDYMFSSHKCIVKDLTVLNNFYAESDHRLIRAVVQIDAKLERYTAVIKRKTKVNPECLTTNRTIYQDEVKDQLNSINTDTSDINELLDHLSSSLCKKAKWVASKDTTGRLHRLQGETKTLLEERRTLIHQGKNHTAEFKLVYRKALQHVESDIDVHRERTVQNIISKHRGPKVFKKALKTGIRQIIKLCDKDRRNLVTVQKEVLKVVSATV